MSERFPELPALPDCITEMLRFLRDDDWWCEDKADGTFDTKPITDDQGDWDGAAEEYVIDPLKAIICKHHGHRMVMDQCGMIAHDFCLTCGRRRDELEAQDK